MSIENDKILIQKILKGETHCFRLLIRQYESMVAKTVYSMIGDKPEAEDIGQEVFIRFYTSLSKFRFEASVGTYLTRIAINLSLNELKKKKPHTSIDQNMEVVSPSESDQFYTKEHIHYGIDQLSEKLKSVAVLRLIQGYSVKETAERLGGSQLDKCPRCSGTERAICEKCDGSGLQE